MSFISSVALFKAFTFHGEAFWAGKRGHRERANIGERGGRPFTRNSRH